MHLTLQFDILSRYVLLNLTIACSLVFLLKKKFHNLAHGPLTLMISHCLYIKTLLNLGSRRYSKFTERVYNTTVLSNFSPSEFSLRYMSRNNRYLQIPL
jgi:hypothetical protein